MKARLLTLLVLLLLSAPGLAQKNRRKVKSAETQYFTASSPDSRYFVVDQFVKRFELGKFQFYNMIRVYHVRSGRYVSNLKFISNAVPDWLKFSPDGRKVILKTGTEYLLLDVRSRSRQQKITNATVVGFIEGGRQLAVQKGSQIEAYDIVQYSELSSKYLGVPNSTKLSSITESPDQKWLIGQGNGCFYLWKKNQKRVFKRLLGHELRFTPDGRHCLSIHYRNRQCYLDIYDASSLEKLKSISSESYLPLSDYVFNSGCSLSPNAKWVAFCAKRHGETKGIGIYNWQTGEQIANVDTVTLQGEPLQMIGQPYSWVGDEGVLFFGEKERQYYRSLQSIDTVLHRRSIDSRMQQVRVSPDGRYKAAYHSSRSKSMILSRTERVGGEQLVDGTFLSYSPNSHYLFLRAKDSTYGYIRTEEIAQGSPKVYPFSTTPYIPGQEDVIAEDSEAPEGYEHIFLHETREWQQATEAVSGMQLQHQGISFDKDTLKWKMHLIDPDGNYYQNALSDTSLWCQLEVHRGDTSYLLPRDQWSIRESFVADTLPIAMAVVMDHSGSMGEERAYVVQQSVDSLISLKRPQDTLALLKYDSSIGIESALCSNSDSLHNRLQKNGLGHYGGGTALLDAVDMAVGILEPIQGYEEKVVLVFTDGKENSSMLSRGEVLSRAVQRGVKVYTIGFGASVDTAYLSQLSQITGGNYAQIYETADFRRIFQDSYRRLQQRYTLETRLPQAGRYELKLTLCLPQSSVTLTTRLRRWGGEEEMQEELLESPAEILMQEEEGTKEFMGDPVAGASKLLNVNFHFDAISLTEASFKELDRAAAYMKEHGHISVELRGHTDAVGNESYNQKLSQKRAERIRHLLIQRGIEPHRLTATGMGEAQPIADNRSEGGRATNRRTEFIILDTTEVRQ